MGKKLPKPSKAELEEGKHLAYLLHELACEDKSCTYGEEYTTEPPPEDSYHCQASVDAENAATSIWRVAALRMLND